MKNRMRRSIKDVGGAVMIESVFGVMACVLVLAFLLSFGFYLYQKTIFRVMVNEISEEVAQTYKYRNAKDATNISKADVSSIGKYRYLINSSTFKTVNVQKTKQLAERRLTLTSLAQENGNTSISVNRIGEDVGRFHLEVTVRQKYNFLLGDLLKVIQLNERDSLSSTVYVEGTDMLFYINTVKLANYGLGKMGDTPLLGVIDSVIKMMQSVYKIFT